MKNRLQHFLVISAGLLVVAGLAGCNDTRQGGRPAPDEANHQHASEAGHATPESFAARVAELKECHEQIKDAFEKNDTEKAHAPLHEVGNLLEALPGLAKAAKLADNDLKTVATAVDQMFAAYGSVDDAVHHGKEPDYKAVASQLDEDMAALEAVLAKR